jgi:thioredoxin reductase (NADPH)
MYESIIIGGGISGLTAALYLARAGIKTLVLESFVCGGQIINSPNIENYPGIPNISGYDLISNLKKQVSSYSNVDIICEEVKEVTLDKVITSNSEYSYKTLIVATGLKRKVLGLANEEELIGSGISYCATCDGAFYKNKDVAIVGGGNTALDDAIYLSNIANKVYLIVRKDCFRGDKVLVDKVSNINNIEIKYSSKVTNTYGNPLNSIEINNDYNINVSGLFIAIGSIPNSKIVSNILDIDSNGYIISEDTNTKVKNIFVCGDVRTKELRQLITASSDGAIAASNVIQYLHN